MKDSLIKLLYEELVPAMGCTEPIAIAYAGAKAREVLGDFPDKVNLRVSGNIVKNVKSVVVPQTGGLKGMDVACIFGIVAGDSSKNLEVIAEVTPEQVETTKLYLASKLCTTSHIVGSSKLHIIVEVFKADNSASVEIVDGHTNIVKIIKNNEVVFEKPELSDDEKEFKFTLKDIYDCAKEIDLCLVEELIDKQITCNVAIANEGLENSWGKNIGRTLIEHFGDSVNVRARAMAAAGSDARMNGCALPVVINSGSGNQGITVSVPIYVFAKEYNKSKEELIRSVVLSNFVSIYLKKGIGKLSAYCGVVSASCGVAAGITNLMGGSYDQVTKAISNTVANVSGIVCDGAKASCAAKIASSVDAGIMAYYMAMSDSAFDSGDGIIDNTIELTIKNVARLGREGMKETDNEIINIMLK